MKTTTVAIIGAGPAGLGAAIQLKRYNIDLFLYESDEVGGLLRNANLVENYPGFPGGIPGAELARLFAEQLQQTGVEINFARVMALRDEGDFFQIETGERYDRSMFLVIATGTQPITFQDFTVPQAAIGRVMYEILPLMGSSGQHFVIVGAGDLAFDYALNLGRQNSVTILNRGSETRCLPLLVERVARNPRIAYREDTCIQIIDVAPDGSLILTCRSSLNAISIGCDYLVGAIGRKPQLDFISGGFMQHVPRLQQEGRLYLIGDVKNQHYRQASIAIGDGVMAAMMIHQRLGSFYT